MQAIRRTVLMTAGSTAVIGVAGLAGRSAYAQSGTFNYKIASNVPTSHPIYVRLSEAGPTPTC